MADRTWWDDVDFRSRDETLAAQLLKSGWQWKQEPLQRARVEEHRRRVLSLDDAGLLTGICVFHALEQLRIRVDPHIERMG